jgi:hypothetical protein
MGHTRTGVVRQRVSTILGGKHVDYVLKNHQEGKRPDQQTEQGRQRQTTARQGQTVPYTQEYDPEPRLQRPDEGDSDMPVTKFQRKIEVSDKFVEDL